MKKYNMVNNTLKVRIARTDGVKLPAYETSGASGMDLRAKLDSPVTLAQGKRALIPTGFSIEIPEGYEAQIRARSGLAVRNGIGMPNGIGTIDSDYRGEIKVALINFGEEDFIINDGDRIAQMIVTSFEKVEWEDVNELSESERGEGGFGHTGVNEDAE